ncbi:hypothetical protein AJ80_08401 [Polytolypa hystricis UAMH7299]|uniref:Uncharacterized protein n=1 Tax=Polytolypa hystricis (strain UAMH7299) TaxID=1447883 RepID=A0A2B7X8P6_POLH7|nr:hypothetical protein AJ80_08401 [Polytolypa hystricis UAMH7299]
MTGNGGFLESTDILAIRHTSSGQDTERPCLKHGPARKNRRRCQNRVTLILIVAKRASQSRKMKIGLSLLNTTFYENPPTRKRQQSGSGGQEIVQPAKKKARSDLPLGANKSALDRPHRSAN